MPRSRTPHRNPILRHSPDLLPAGWGHSEEEITEANSWRPDGLELFGRVLGAIRGASPTLAAKMLANKGVMRPLFNAPGVLDAYKARRRRLLEDKGIEASVRIARDGIRGTAYASPQDIPVGALTAAIEALGNVGDLPSGGVSHAVEMILRDYLALPSRLVHVVQEQAGPANAKGFAQVILPALVEQWRDRYVKYLVDIAQDPRRRSNQQSLSAYATQMVDRLEEAAAEGVSAEALLKSDAQTPAALAASSTPDNEREAVDRFKTDMHARGIRPGNAYKLRSYMDMSDYVHPPAWFMWREKDGRIEVRTLPDPPKYGDAPMPWRPLNVRSREAVGDILRNISSVGALPDFPPVPTVDPRPPAPDWPVNTVFTMGKSRKLWVVTSPASDRYGFTAQALSGSDRGSSMSGWYARGPEDIPTKVGVLGGEGRVGRKVVPLTFTGKQAYRRWQEYANAVLRSHSHSTEGLEARKALVMPWERLSAEGMQEARRERASAGLKARVERQEKAAVKRRTPAQPKASKALKAHWVTTPAGPRVELTPAGHRDLIRQLFGIGADEHWPVEKQVTEAFEEFLALRARGTGGLAFSRATSAEKAAFRRLDKYVDLKPAGSPDAVYTVNARGYDLAKHWYALKDAAMAEVSRQGPPPASEVTRKGYYKIALKPGEEGDGIVDGTPFRWVKATAQAGNYGAGKWSDRSKVYTVTHIPSGLRIDETRKARDAKSLVQFLAANVPTQGADARFGAPSSIPPGEVREIGDTIRRWNDQ